MTRRDALGDVQPAACTNLALWLDRFPLGLKQEALRSHHQIALARIEVPSGYRAAFEARTKAIEALDGGFEGGATRLFELELTGRAIVGIGAASVRETALSLLRPWGVPFIPGSALKGLASHVAHESEGDWKRPAKPGEKAGSLHRRIFGDVTSAGAVVFHDAWWKPDPTPPVVADTMTVHHADYYQRKDAPGDWDEPNPVSFLSVRGTYLVALSGPAQAIEVVRAMLERGLAERGVGAKTAAGYGRGTLEEVESKVSEKLRGFDPPRLEAGNIGPHIKRFLAIVREVRTEQERQEARARAAELVQNNKKVFKKWLSDPKRTDEQREWFGIVPSREPAPGRAPDVAKKAPSPEAEAWVWSQAQAYARRDKKNRVHVHVGDVAIEQGKLTQGRPSKELLDKLLDASEEDPLDVDVIWKGKKLRGIRER